MGEGGAVQLVRCLHHFVREGSGRIAHQSYDNKVKLKTDNPADGFVERRIYSNRPLRHEDHLTEKGEAFYPVLLALRAWGVSPIA